jgi:LmbE family N-acetylglucosaminyl deacetylase
VKALFHYFLPAGLMPTFVVDITHEFPRWLEALKAHRSQFLNPKKSLDYLWFLESMARTYGNYIRTRYGQGFAIGEPFKIDDLTLLAG